MIPTIIQAFYLYLPAGIANMVPVLVKWFPFLDKPVDSNLRIRGKRIFGANKTWRGILFGTLAAILTVYIQKLLYPSMKAYSIVNYSETNVIILGILLGFGALVGDLLESFFKRQKGIVPGKSWLLWDQLDWIIGAIVFSYSYVQPSTIIIFTALILFSILHPIFNLIGYLFRIKNNPL